MINELAAQRMGFRNPADAVGKTVSVAFVDAGIWRWCRSRIIGVVQRLALPLDPRADRSDHVPARTDQLTGVLLVRYDGRDPQRRARPRRAGLEAARARRAVRRRVQRGHRIAELYEAEEARAKVFAGFALLAVIVACLGLFGLAAFTAERRTKEIGIRKVLGARTRDIVRLLAWQFSKPVIVANLIAWPVAWWVMRDWLNDFDARIDLGPTPFVLAGLLALVIAIGTIAGHAFKVARANPIHALRYE